MNYGIKQKRTKQVTVTFEWTEKGDLISVLSDLSALISSGVETHHNQKKSILTEDKWHEVEFSQKYVDKIHEEVESDINGELKLVIKSKI
jgi:hypothetical protein